MNVAQPIEFEYHVVPKLNSRLTLQVNPHVVCELSHPRLDSEPLELFADERGVVRVSLRAEEPGSETFDLIEILSTGERIHHTIKIHADPHRIPESGQLSTRDLAKPPTHKVIPPIPPALLDADRSQLIAAGYPPRPPKDASASLHAAWAAKVSREWKRVNPTLVAGSRQRRFGDTNNVVAQERPVESPTLPLPPPKGSGAFSQMLETILPRHADPIAKALFNDSSTGWSGATLNGTPRARTNPWQATCDFQVPVARITDPRHVLGPYFEGEVALWVGITSTDGALLQSGVDCDSFSAFGMLFSTYALFIEAFPYLPWYIPNIAVSAGDHINIALFIADDYGQSWFGEDSYRNTSMWFMVSNYTTRQDYWGTEPLKADRYNFVAESAAFILERPGHTDGSVLPMPVFCQALMWNCSYMTDFGRDRTSYGLTDDSGATRAMLNLYSEDLKRVLVYSAIIDDENSYEGHALEWLQTGWYS